MTTNNLIFAAAGTDTPTAVEDVFSTYLYTGDGASQTISNGIALNSTSEWRSSTFNQSVSPNDYAWSTAADASGNHYVTGSSYDGTQNCIYVIKYNSSGTVQWQRKSYESGYSYGYGVTVDASSNVYVTGQVYDTVSSSYASVVKYNSSGTLQWQRKISQGTYSYGGGITIDASSNVYVTGYANDATRDYAFIAKYNSSGTLQWQRKFYENNTYGNDITADASSNVYVTGYANDGIRNYAFVAKYNSSGTLQWQRKFYENNTYGNRITVDASSNVYVTGYSDSSNYSFVAKYNSSGTLQWQRKVYQSSTHGYGITSDTGGNVYITGYATLPRDCGFVVKYDSSGALQWQRYINQNLGVVYPYTIVAGPSNSLYVAGQFEDRSIGPSYYSSMVIKLQQDGSTTSGQAGEIYMNTGGLTDEAGTATDTAGTATDAAGTATDAAGTATDAAGGMTFNTYTQPAVVANEGLVWIKSRTSAGTADTSSGINQNNHYLLDNVRGNTYASNSASPYGQDSSWGSAYLNFSSVGFNTGNNQGNGWTQDNGNSYASWTFRKSPGFFDIVTYTGNGSNRTIAHDLGAVPGCIMVKRLDTTGDWQVYHRSLANTNYLVLNSDAAVATGADRWNSTTATASAFSLGTNANVNASGGTYVAYLFGHDTSVNGMIQCGTFNADSSGRATIDLGWEPQWLLLKTGSAPEDWLLYDTMRGWSQTNTMTLRPSFGGAEVDYGAGMSPTATGFSSPNGWFYASQTFYYIAIRRGPMRKPNNAVDVFNMQLVPIATGAPLNTDYGFVTDLVISEPRNLNNELYQNGVITRQTWLATLSTSNTDAESFTKSKATWDSMIGIKTIETDNYTLGGNDWIHYAFRRAPGFFDVVCFEDGSGIYNHGLGVPPELIIQKRRNSTGDWNVNGTVLGNNVILLNYSFSAADAGWSTGFPVYTATQFSPILTLGSFVNYLFASCPGVSKVGSYTGNGSSQTINCGFAAGARFVLIKRTDSTGDWYVWDSARGIVLGNDPHLSLNTTAAEVTTDDSISTNATGFIVNQVSATNINVNGATYIYLAIA